jgi:probable phosphoglycerate mutase
MRLISRLEQDSVRPWSLIRHGETAWSRTGQHAGRTDLPLTEAGENAARALAPRLAGGEFVAVYSSPLTRAVRTAKLAALGHAEPDADLIEWDYGRYEGLTAEQIRELTPGWELWRDGGRSPRPLPAPGMGRSAQHSAGTWG